MSSLIPKPLIFVSFLCILFLNGCSESPSENIVQWPLASGCDLHETPCTVSHNGQSVTLEISPHPIPVARPLGIEVGLEGLNPDQIEIDISGVNMYMGYNRVPLISSRPDQWKGTSMLAFCTLEEMQWQITLLIQQDQQQIQIPFQLTTQKPSL